MTAQIRALGTALPKYSIEQQEAARTLQQLQITQRWNKALPGLYRKSGVDRRSSVLLLNDKEATMDRQDFYAHVDSMPQGPSTAQRMEAYQKYAGPLLEEACRAAAETESSFAEVTHLVTVSCTGFVTPGIDHWLIRNLPLRPNTQRFHIGFMGCHGAINGIRVAEALVKADPKAVVLLGAIELCSIHQQYTEDPQQLVANALFADGAAAMIVANESMQSPTSDTNWRIASSKSLMIPDTLDHMGWIVGNHGFEMNLSPEVPAIIHAQLAEPVQQWLDSLNLTINDIDAWAVHPGGPRILDAVEATFHLPFGKLSTSRQVLAEHGNMSSPTVLFILERLTAQNPQARHCLLVAFGPGLHAELMLLSR